MNQPLAFFPGVSIVLLALHRLHDLLGHLIAVLHRRALRRAQAAGADTASQAQARPGLWTALLHAARVHRHGQHD